MLKDAASTAIYGSRATNGVVVVTTKRAKGSKVQVDYNGYYAIQNSINKPQMMGLEDYMRMQVAAYTNAGSALPARFTEASIQAYINATDREKYPLPNTWFQTVLHAAPQQKPHHRRIGRQRSDTYPLEPALSGSGGYHHALRQQNR